MHVCTYVCMHVCMYVHTYVCMLNKNTMGVKKVRGQSEAACSRQVRPKALISAETKNKRWPSDKANRENML